MFCVRLPRLLHRRRVHPLPSTCSASSSSSSSDSIIDIPTETRLPESASVVVAGAGLIGNSVAYHLVERGWKDVVIIDKGNIADGTSK